MRLIKVNSWYINLDQVTYINNRGSYIEVGFINGHIQLSNEDALCLLEILDSKPDYNDVTSLRHNGGKS